MKKKAELFICYFFVSILCVFMVTIFARVLIKNILVEKLDISNEFTKWALHGVSTVDAVDEVTGETFAQIDWKTLYPFDYASNENSEVKVEKKSYLVQYKSKIQQLENVLNDYCTTYLAGRTFFVEKAYAYDKIIGWNLTSNSVTDGLIQLKNGYLAQSHGKSDTTKIAEHVVGLHQFLNEKNIDFLYIQAPTKMSTTNKLLPAGVEDYANENADELLKTLESQNVDTLDLRPNMYDISDDFYGAFYRTDHHWKTTTAFQMAGVIVDYLNDNYEYEFDEYYYDLDNYAIERYENYFLGSLGKKITLAKAKPEDFELIVPQFERNFSVQIPERYIDITGSFQDTLLDYRHLETIDYYNENCYASFMNRNDAVGTIHNNTVTCNEGKKILMIKDSYATPVIPYLALGIEDMELLYEIRFTGSVKSYIEQCNPDMVIVMYSADNVSGDGEGEMVPFSLQ